MTDVQRVLRIREDKPALQALLQKGSIGDDLWNSLIAAEKELEAEIMEVISEANSFVDGWGQVIFPTANEMLANEKIRAVYERSDQLKAELGTHGRCSSRTIPDLCFLEMKYEMKVKYQLTPITGPPPGTPSTPNRPNAIPLNPASPEKPAPSDTESAPGTPNVGCTRSSLSHLLTRCCRERSKSESRPSCRRHAVGSLLVYAFEIRLYIPTPEANYNKDTNMGSPRPSRIIGWLDGVYNANK